VVEDVIVGGCVANLGRNGLKPVVVSAGETDASVEAISEEAGSDDATGVFQYRPP
jgi:hypothetical protein